MSLVLLVALQIFPQAFPRLMGFPREVGRSGSASGREGRFAKTWFETIVGEWSAKTGNHPGSLLVFLALWHFDSSAHNPEVVGSSPASATISQTLESSDSKVSFYAQNLMIFARKHFLQLGFSKPCLAISTNIPGRQMGGV